MAKVDRILELFPAFYRATDRNKLLAEVIGVLATPLEEIESNLFRIQRAHRLRVAEDVQDVIRLAGTLNLTSFHFEDIASDDSLDYETKLSAMRDRVQRIARIHLKGLGTPWSILEFVSIFLRSVIVSETNGEPLIKHVDSEGYSHKARVEFAYSSEKPRSRLYLHENPVRRRKIELAERWQLNHWTTESHSVVDAPVRLMIQGVEDHTVMPSVFCVNTGEGIIFNGQNPAGQRLIIDSDNGAILEGTPVNQWLTYFKGGIYDFGQWERTSFVSEEGVSDTLYSGTPEQKGFGYFARQKSPPMASPGQSEWRFKVAEGLYDGDRYDFAVYNTENAPVGQYNRDCNFDECSYDYPSGGIVGMAWDERIPCAFKLVLPSQLPVADRKTRSADSSSGEQPEPETTKWVETGNVLNRVSSLIPRFKAGGIQAFVDIEKSAWILGESVIRDATANSGEGIDRYLTRLLQQNADTFVPLDTATEG